MELKRFQASALADVESYLSRYLASGDAALAWRNHWLAKGVEPDRRYVDRLGGIPDVCVKIPTGGGKTFLACNALAPLAGTLMGGRGLVLWYVPSLAILSQTIAALRDPEHPYRRKLESLFAGRVKAISKAEALVATAIDMRRKLESLAKVERGSGGPYIRPIVLFQAEPKSRDDATTFRRVKERLIVFGIPDTQVKIKTAEVDELEGLDLMSESCPVRYVITVNALKEGWDCPFAYVLASLADRSSAVDVEQIVGRVLRRPYARRFENRFLNLSYVFTSSSRFLETLDTVVKGLNRAGFGDDDYRVEESQRAPTAAPPAGAAPLLEDLDKVMYREQLENDDYAAPDSLSGERPAGPSYGSAGRDDGVGAESLDVAAVSRLVEGVEAVPAEAAPRELREAVFAGIGSLKTYPLKDEFRAAALAIKLPVFRIAADPGGLFGSEGSRDLEKEDLLDDFRLGLEGADIALPLASVDLYQVDLEGAEGDTRLERRRLDLPEAERFLSFLKSLSDADFKRELLGMVMSLLHDVDAVSDRDLKAYVKRVIEGQAEAALAEMRGEPYRYAQAIRARIDGIMTEHARRRFFEDTTTNAVFAEPRWAFPQRLECAEARRGLPRSLYDACSPMNSFEAQVAEALSSSPNVLFWHRNRERKDFKLNGFINHYPDFIAMTRSGNALLVESKGDDRDNGDSERKLALGKEWERLAGPKYKYFMVFQTLEVEGAWPMAEALRLIAKL